MGLSVNEEGCACGEFGSRQNKANKMINNKNLSYALNTLLMLLFASNLLNAKTESHWDRCPRNSVFTNLTVPKYKYN